MNASFAGSVGPEDPMTGHPATTSGRPVVETEPNGHPVILSLPTIRA